MSDTDDKKYRKIFSDLPDFETERLILRKICRQDLYDMYDFFREEEVFRYLFHSPHLNVEETAGRIEFLEKQYKKGRCAEWGVVLKSENRLIGTCCFTGFDFENNKAEIGYVLSPRFRGRGLMGEAVRELMRVGFELLGLNRIEARILEGNTASERLASALGMQFEGKLRDALLVKGVYKSFSYYAVTAGEYFVKDCAAGINCE